MFFSKMKVKNLGVLMLSGIIPLTSMPALGVDFTFTNNTTNRVCNDKYRNIDLGIKINNNRVDGNFRSDSNGCLTIRISESSCTNVRIFAIDTAHSGQEFAEGPCRSSSVGGGGSGQVGGGNTPSKPSLTNRDWEKVQDVAAIAAREFANSEVKRMDLTPAHNAYNYILGLLAADREVTPGNPAYDSARDFGLSKGSDSGAPVGKTAGTNYGLSAGSENGSNEVTAQYRQMALNSSKEKDWSAKLDTSLPSYSGGSFSGSAETSADRILAQKTSEFRSGIDDSDLNQAILNKDANFDIGTSWFNKWTSFNNYKIKLSDSGHLKFYENLLKKYEDGERAQRAFEETFSRTYTEVIDEKIEKVVKRKSPDGNAYQRGRADGTEAIRSIVYGHAYNQSYVSSAQAAAREAFASSYPGAYKTAFEKQERYLEENAVIEGLQVDIVDSEGKKEFVIGQPITLVIKSMLNIGRKSKSLEIVLSESINAKESMTVNGLSQVKDQKFVNIASISPTAKLGSSIVKVCVGNACSQHTIELKWENQIKGLAKEGVDETAAELLSTFIRGALLDEWKMVYEKYQGNASDWHTDYDTLQANPITKANEPTVSKKTNLGKFFETMKQNKSNPVFKERIAKIGKEYLTLKRAMVELTTVKEKFKNTNYFQVLLQLDGDQSPREYPFSKIPNDLKPAAIHAFEVQMNELYRMIEEDPILKKQMSDCPSKSKKAKVSCLQFMDQSESETYFRGWTLGDKQMSQKLDELNGKVASTAKK